MNKIFLSHTTSFHTYRKSRSAKLNIEFTASNLCPNQNSNVHVASIQNLTDVLSLQKIDVLVANSSKRYKHQNVMFRTNAKKYPKSAFSKISNNLYISSAELMFCQMAEILTYEKLFLLGLEICGNYVIDKDVETGFINDISALTTVSKIKKFCAELRQYQPRQRGIARANFVANLLENNSASPQESRLYIILSSPRYLGGFGIENLHFNQQINLSFGAQKICNKNFVKPDLCNPQTKIAIEYDSDAFHSDNSKNRQDKRRLDALNYDGWTTCNFVSEEMHDITALRHLANIILKKNKQPHRIRIKNFDSLLQNLLLNLQL